MGKKLPRGLIVSCQALENEPLHSPFIMGRMAVAAQQGGAAGIRANGAEDVAEIRSLVPLPVIGIIKREYPGMAPYITPTDAEIEALVRVGAEVIALDATIDQDETFLSTLHKRWPGQAFMADISTAEEGLRADKLDFDYIGTTLIGYTTQSKGLDKFEVLRRLIAECRHPVIAEGNFNTPEQAAEAIRLGAHAVVVGSAITRPQLIARSFGDAVNAALNG
ncbi:N-acetylmannosamine-6-phosphate 2-epimerase [Butyricicoccus faecihominis]|uniref:N-acetylmannosamine-6-phosphate 2-epimerase n=1 Tax=Butyricicoccus faecihominis TaxID=1712515 RepID=UPI00247B27E1|nr:N-acetylmannosamine-6-phosphate 2-epimerase [Butyricicoccus faecihominis]MCQ5130543.1 N-acetylmannosamine-6-phosphate 2-epimerase [Butyricicoccus faecihominis]